MAPPCRPSPAEPRCPWTVLKKSPRWQEVEDACGKDSALPVGQSCIGSGDTLGTCSWRGASHPAVSCPALLRPSVGCGRPRFGPSAHLGTCRLARGLGAGSWVLPGPACVVGICGGMAAGDRAGIARPWAQSVAQPPSSASTWWLRLGPCQSGVCRWSCARPAFPEPCVLGLSSAGFGTRSRSCCPGVVPSIPVEGVRDPAPLPCFPASPAGGLLRAVTDGQRGGLGAALPCVL